MVQSNWEVKDTKVQYKPKVLFGAYTTDDSRIRANRFKFLEAYVETICVSIPLFEYKKGFFPQKKLQSNGHQFAIGMRYASSHVLENPVFDGYGKIELKITDLKFYEINMGSGLVTKNELDILWPNRFYALDKIFLYVKF